MAEAELIGLALALGAAETPQWWFAEERMSERAVKISDAMAAKYRGAKLGVGRCSGVRI